MKPYIKNRLWIFIIGTLLIFIYKTDFSVQISRILSVLAPFTAALAISWFLLPLKLRLERLIAGSGSALLQKHKNGLAAFFTYLLFLGLLTAAVLFLIPPVRQSITDISAHLPEYLKTLNSYVDTGKLGELILDALHLNKPETFVTGAKITIGYIFSVLMTFVVLIYVLLEHKQLKAFAVQAGHAVLGGETTDKIIYCCSRVNTLFIKYFYGRLLSSVFLGMLVTISFLVTNVKYPVLFGIIAAITNLIPYFGPFVGGIPPVLTTLADAGPTKALWTAVLLFIAQQIENNILSPKILGDHIGLSGFWILFAVVLGGGLFGFWGMLLSIPVAASIKMLFFEYWNSAKKRLL